MQLLQTELQVELSENVSVLRTEVETAFSGEVLMKTFLCLVLVVLPFIWNLGITPKLGIYMYHPIPHYIGMLP